MVRVTGVQEVELGVAELILPDPGFKLGPIARDEAGGLVDDV